MNWNDIRIKKRYHTESISEYVDDVLLDIASEQKDDGLAIIQSCWDAIIDDERVSKIAKPIKLEGDTLTLKVRSAAWRQEMHSQSSLIIKRIQEKLPDCDVENIIFR